MWILGNFPPTDMKNELASHQRDSRSHLMISAQIQSQAPCLEPCSLRAVELEVQQLLDLEIPYYLETSSKSSDRLPCDTTHHRLVVTSVPLSTLAR